MNTNTRVWVASKYGDPDELTVYRAISDGVEWFTTKREAWLAIAERERVDAEHKQLGADEAVKRMESARKAASECAP